VSWFPNTTITYSTVPVENHVRLKGIPRGFLENSLLDSSEPLFCSILNGSTVQIESVHLHDVWRNIEVVPVFNETTRHKEVGAMEEQLHALLNSELGEGTGNRHGWAALQPQKYTSVPAGLG